MSARKGSQLFAHPSRKTMWFPLCAARTRNGTTRAERTTHGAAVERVRISVDHFDRAGSPLCAYYVFIMAAYQESRDKTTGASRTPPFAPLRDSLWRPFHITFKNPGVPGRGLINWHRDTCPAGLGGPLAFNDTRQSHRFRSLSSMIAIVRLTEGKEKLSHDLLRW